MFQIASIILWSIDDYYYYAFCIALISAISIGSTLIETKQVRKTTISLAGPLTLVSDHRTYARDVPIFLSRQNPLRWQLYVQVTQYHNHSPDSLELQGKLSSPQN